MAVAPIRNVRQVVDYALTEMPPEKIYLGIPNYGYDWPLPYREGNRATSISNQYAVELAARHYAAIRFDDQAQSPWFRYVDVDGREHEVWFEDARSIRAKLDLAREYGRSVLACAGDAPNDASMLQEADFAFSPADRDPALKVDGLIDTVPCDDGSVADAIEKLEKLI